MAVAQGFSPIQNLFLWVMCVCVCVCVFVTNLPKHFFIYIDTRIIIVFFTVLRFCCHLVSALTHCDIEENLK